MRLRGGRDTALVPLASALVTRLRPSARTLRLSPPAGLLPSAAGARAARLQRLRADLLPYCKPEGGGGGGDASASPPGGRLAMPSCARLLRDGRRDLVNAVQAAGGFQAVAALLRLKGA